jgi:RNA polymerase sigma-70 factor (ECF subfamily)
MTIEATKMGTARNFVSAQPIMMTWSTEFAELYEDHYAAVYRTALRVTGNASDAEDVLQTVFLRVLAKGDRLSPNPLPEAYFRRAATNAAVDIIRRKISHAETRIDDALAYPAKESPALLKERLRRAIAKLEQNDATLFLMRYLEGYSNEELAEIFHQEKNNIAVRLHRIRQTLQIEMER